MTQNGNSCVKTQAAHHQLVAEKVSMIIMKTCKDMYDLLNKISMEVRDTFKNSKMKRNLQVTTIKENNRGEDSCKTSPVMLVCQMIHMQGGEKKVSR